MTYVEKMVMEIGGNVANHHCNQGMATMIVEKIIADTKEACLDAIWPFRNFQSMNYAAYVRAIEKAEVRGED